MHSYEKAYACMALLCAYSRTRDTRTGGTNYSISGWKQPYETGSDSRMRADERRNHRGSQGMLQYMRVASVRARAPRTAPPSEFLLLLRFNEMLRPLARDYFPIAPINSPFDRFRLSWRDSGTPFLPDDPWGYDFHRRLLYFIESCRLYDAYSGEFN